MTPRLSVRCSYAVACKILHIYIDGEHHITLKKFRGTVSGEANVVRKSKTQWLPWMLFIGYTKHVISITQPNRLDSSVIMLSYVQINQVNNGADISQIYFCRRWETKLTEITAAVNWYPIVHIRQITSVRYWLAKACALHIYQQLPIHPGSKAHNRPHSAVNKQNQGKY